MIKSFPLRSAVVAVVAVVILVGSVAAVIPPRGANPNIEVIPNTQHRIHKVGNLWVTVTNWGFFGNLDDQFIDPETGETAPYATFPAGSNQQYLYIGAMWLGGYLDGWQSPRVSVGFDGWERISELYPTSGTAGDFIERSTRTGDPLAISEEDYICTYTDTLTNQTFVAPDPIDGPHQPLGIQVDQRSYAWSYAYARDFILFDYTITNINPTASVLDLFMALYMDQDCLHSSEDPYGAEEGAQDDICGFKPWYVSPTGDSTRINMAWIADNDGQPYGGVYTDLSVRHVTGTRVVRAPVGDVNDLQFSFNWYISNIDEDYDWGPMLIANYTNWDGTPIGDVHKYELITNGEFDYGQVYAAQVFEGWVDPYLGVPDPPGLADGYDTRYVLSFGPIGLQRPDGRYEILPGDSMHLTVAYVAGENFHVDPTYVIDPMNPTEDVYDFSDFAFNANWAQLVFDNDGDGEPDFKGPPPPDPPDIRAETSEGSILLNWNRRSEDPAYLDPFSDRQDFEGYRVYTSHTGVLADFGLHLSFDRVNYDTFYVDEYGEFRMYPGDSLLIVPLDRDSLIARHGFDPNVSDDELAAFNWYPHDWNRDLPELVGEDGVWQEGEYFVDEDSVGSPGYGQYDVGEFYLDGHYEYMMSNLVPTIGVYVSVTAFDTGEPQSQTEPLESSQLANVLYVMPTAGPGAADKPVGVVPNPYRADAQYHDPTLWGPQPWEDPDRSGWTEHDRRIRFTNLPGECTIRIYTLDGDLVDTVENVDDDSYEDWDLISRNSQAIVSGVYLFSCEWSGGNEIGKFVIIK